MGAHPQDEEALLAAVARGYAQRDRADMAPTIAYFTELAARFGDHPVALLELAGAHDTAGNEETARGLYEQALDGGLEGDALRRCLCQYASTLRWLGEHDASLEVLVEAARLFPGSEAVRVFRALTLLDAGRPDEAVADLLGVVVEHADVTDLGRWAPGLGGVAAWLRQGRPDEDQTRNADG
ncbi:tetratricopeptide repeat protein [Nocardioides zeae]|uniref:Tetratricopeptide repeat protein n=1 Tax=Nocardioides imazamoxiresistens TaxID=3231893 RepID=A0ABU3PT38_9ACTN|nr:tetratricopeptide repeat protein [Nocardioides zeae]MDT9592363.1 tetratricopeptide repeat protein [Nocardioides zeae]